MKSTNYPFPVVTAPSRMSPSTWLGSPSRCFSVSGFSKPDCPDRPDKEQPYISVSGYPLAKYQNIRRSEYQEKIEEYFFNCSPEVLVRFPLIL
jgi:hypothetical protein